MPAASCRSVSMGFAWARGTVAVRQLPRPTPWLGTLPIQFAGLYERAYVQASYPLILTLKQSLRVQATYDFTTNILRQRAGSPGFLPPIGFGFRSVSRSIQFLRGYDQGGTLYFPGHGEARRQTQPATRTGWVVARRIIPWPPWCWAARRFRGPGQVQHTTSFGPKRVSTSLCQEDLRCR